MPYSVDLLIDLITASTPDEHRCVSGTHDSGKRRVELSMGRLDARLGTLCVWFNTTIAHRDNLSSINVGWVPAAVSPATSNSNWGKISNMSDISSILTGVGVICDFLYFFALFVCWKQRRKLASDIAQMTRLFKVQIVRLLSFVHHLLQLLSLRV